MLDEAVASGGATRRTTADLLRAFGARRMTIGAREGVQTALASVGLATNPPLVGPDPDGDVEIYVLDPDLPREERPPEADESEDATTSELEQRALDLEAALAARDQHVRELDAARTEAHSRLEETERALDDAETAASAAAEAADAAQAETAEERRRREEVEALLQSARDQELRMRAELGEQQARARADWEERHARARVEWEADHARALTEWEEELARERERRESAEELVRTTRDGQAKARAEWQLEVDRLEHELQSEQARAADLEQQLHDLAVERSMATADVARTQSEFDAALARAEEGESTAARLRQQTGGLRQSLERERRERVHTERELERRVTELARRHAKAATAAKQYETALEAANQALAQAGQNAGALEPQIVALREELGRREAEIARLAQEQSAREKPMAEALGAARDDLAKERGERQRLAEHARELEEERRDLVHALKAAERRARKADKHADKPARRAEMPAAASPETPAPRAEDPPPAEAPPPERAPEPEAAPPPPPAGTRRRRSLEERLAGELGEAETVLASAPGSQNGRKAILAVTPDRALLVVAGDDPLSLPHSQISDVKIGRQRFGRVEVSVAAGGTRAFAVKLNENAQATYYALRLRQWAALSESHAEMEAPPAEK